MADRPEHLILTHLPVPPVCIRPSVEMDGVAGRALHSSTHHLN